MQDFYIRLLSYLKADRGATGVEYGIMVAAIAAVIVATVFLIGLSIEGAFETVLAQLP